MNVKAEAQRQAAPERVYPLATVLNLKPYRSIRQRRRRDEMLIAVFLLATAAVAMLWLFN